MLNLAAVNSKMLACLTRIFVRNFLALECILCNNTYSNLHPFTTETRNKHSEN